MALTGIVHDFQPVCLRHRDGARSILTLPLGSSHLLNSVYRALREVECGEVWVVPAFEPEADYERALKGLLPETDLFVVAPEEREQPFHRADPTETFLLVDPRYLPFGGFDFKPLMRAYDEHGSAICYTGAEAVANQSAESVVSDSAGNVRLVQRVLDRADWGQRGATIVSACAVPYALASQESQFPLAAMRRRLAARGVPLCDIAGHAGTLPLNRREDVLEVCWASMDHAQDAASSAIQRLPGHARVFAAANATVAPSARMVGHIVIHDGAQIGENATVIGPALIGRNAVIGDGATVAQCVLFDAAHVQAGSVAYGDILFTGPSGRRRHCETSLRRPAAIADQKEFQLVVNGQSHDGVASHRRGLTLALKRAVDIATSVALLVLLAPLLVVVAAIVKMSSPGPVFFAHVREGRGGRAFRCLKFRTMTKGADQLQRQLAAHNEADGPQFVMRNDPRVTTVGRVLRRYNIDELPQLVNVLLGHMSLVGPRPSPYSENQICTPWRHGRLSVRPGITGLWQLCRRDRDEGDFPQWIYFDTLYVRHLCLSLDAKILWHTLRTFGGRWSVDVGKIVKTEAGRSDAAPVHDAPGPRRLVGAD